MMFRYKIVIEYDGTKLVGWQKQESGLSVQGHLEEAIRQFSGMRTAVQGAGRTDAGVHALGQVGHFDLMKPFAEETVKNAINHFLKPKRIIIHQAIQVAENFHARFDATSKTYIYKILNRPTPPALLKGYVWHIPETLDIQLMQEAANSLIGHHDFSSFRSAGCQAKSALRTLDQITLTKNEDIIEISLSARSFLYNQVRIIVGCLRRAGNGRFAKGKMKKILEARSRTKAAEIAPPCGLYLTQVKY